MSYRRATAGASPPGPRWRWLIWAIAAEALLFELMFAGPSTQTFGSRTLTPYLVLPSFNRLGAVWAATNIAWAAIFALVLASLGIYAVALLLAIRGM